MAPTGGSRTTVRVQKVRGAPFSFLAAISTSAHQIVMKRKITVKGMMVNNNPNLMVSMSMVFLLFPAAVS
jgi:hypothetical protein